ncbi:MULTISPECIES: glycosyltransferase family 1 protein [Hungatella]|uniref:glycosyltransferase family 1 protein n=1 Tax=Hungatella TaxID=1649459 RepID=UPI002A80C976|nr:glycosyltransferase family 1 protein [Hungatella effluvii]
MADITQEGTQTGCIRVLHFVSTLSRGSGVMSVIMNYYRHIDRDKVQFDFLHFIACEDSYMEEIRELGGKIYCIDKPGSSFQSIKQLNSFFRLHAGEYTWLHNHEVYLTFLLRPIAKRYGLEKFIVHCHATKYSDKTLNAVRNRILCLPIRFMKVERFACSEAAGKFLYGEKMLKAGKVFIMHNAIDCEKFRFRPEVRERLRKEMGLDGKFVIGHVGRFERQKNHEFLIEVFAEVKKRIPESMLLLVGEGTKKNWIEYQVEKINLTSNVLFLGQRSDVENLLQAMDILLLPSRYEGLGIVLFEAQAAGMKCFVSDYVPKESSAGNITYLPLKDASPFWSSIILKEYQKYKESNISLRNAASDLAIRKMNVSGKTLQMQTIKIQNHYLAKE